MIIEQYKATYRKRYYLLAILFILLVVLAVCSLLIGSYNIPIREFILSMLGRGSQYQSVVIFNLRLPRTVSAIVSGSGLAIAGVAIQRLLRNPIASPFTIGVSQGAAFGASFAIMFFSSSVAGLGFKFFSGIYSVTLFAFFGAVISTVVILTLAKIKHFTNESVVLAGVALSALFSSGTVLLQYFASEKELSSIVFWTFGDISRSSWSEIILLIILFLFVYLYLRYNRWNFNALTNGHEVAVTLGVKVSRIAMWGMFAATLLAALITAFNGVIAFVGLLAPHIAVRLAGSDFRQLLPCTALIGGILLLAADCIGRMILSSGSIPVGILTSFMGAPLFLYLLINSSKR